MSYNFEFSAVLTKKLSKLARKDPLLVRSLHKKVEQIISCDKEGMMHYKNLVGDMSDLKRVHIGHHVLLFRILEDTVIFEDLRHHDDAYKD